jgi:hypothetical protein
MRTHPDVERLLARLDHPLQAEIEAVRRLILGAHSAIHEEVKWNAPSFRTHEHFATFHLRATDAVKLVLHTGATKTKAPKRPLIDDPAELLEWLGVDRAMVTLRDAADVRKRGKALKAVIRQWVAQLPAARSTIEKLKEAIDGAIETVRKQRATLRPAGPAPRSGGKANKSDNAAPRRRIREHAVARPEAPRPGESTRSSRAPRTASPRSPSKPAPRASPPPPAAGASRPSKKKPRAEEARDPRPRAPSSTTGANAFGNASPRVLLKQKRR